MAAPSNKQSTSAARTSPLPAPTTNVSSRLERGHPGLRRSTPDSEALASSDDDGDNLLLSHSMTAPATKPVRRSSWLNEVPLSIQRKHSLPGGPLSSAPSNPASPASDQAPWTNISPGLSSSYNWNQAGSSFPWGTGIWNGDSRKEPPSRLSEIVPSPTMTSTQISSGYLGDEMFSPITRTISGESAIPFSIPLEPTPKTYRSQSYSVGQMDPEYLGMMANKRQMQYPSRTRGSQQRASRPSMLGELGHDPAMLDRVREDDDGMDSMSSSDGDLSYSASQARTIEQLARENALLRQAAGQMDNRFRERASSSASVAGGLHSIHRMRGSIPDQDLAVEDLGELRDVQGYGNLLGAARRRFSEHSANIDPQFSTYPNSLENRALDNVRKAHWQTTLGFGSISEQPQSRRHSFADIPVRHDSMSSVDSNSVATPRASGDRDDIYGNSGEYSAQEFYPHGQLRADGSSGLPASLNQYAISGAYGHQGLAVSHTHQNHLLYLVTFKCHRADVFYIQEDTGLQVKAGDLVIVEADRGTDLGTVQQANVSLQRARELKQQYAEEHYKWLMMFSRQGQAESATVPSAGFANRSAAGGMGPHAHGGQETSTEIKPKLIKRLAQNHEIMNLRDKEGNEAKAKRVCQAKVAEHRLNMEILDAEFQMDWKKLTFYYFADSYINFNSLVTDLFKIYKTRIWMSAINPASFVTPTAGLPGPGMGNPLYGQDVSHTERHNQDGRSYGRDTVDAAREQMLNPMLRTAFPESYQPFAQSPRQSQIDPFGPYSPTNYDASLEAFSDYPAGTANGARLHSPQAEWVGRFQGLSLNS